MNGQRLIKYIYTKPLIFESLNSGVIKVSLDTSRIEDATTVYTKPINTVRIILIYFDSESPYIKRLNPRPKQYNIDINATVFIIE